MAKDQVQWTSPSPFWPDAAIASDTVSRRALLQRPAILRFASDTFMNDFMNMLETDPMQLPKYVAKPETWRGPTIGPPPVKPVPAFARTLNRLGLAAARQKNAALQASGGLGASSLVATTPASTAKLKLYQPGHQRYYLVTACLVCGRAGLPDRAIDPARAETATFVVRRLFPPGPLDINVPLPTFNASTWEEYALVSGASGSGWQRIPRASQSAGGIAVEGEEQLPLFGMNFTEEDGRRRRLFAGLVPSGKRETYMGATMLKQANDPAPVVPPQAVPDGRMILLWSTVTEPWKALIERASTAGSLNEGMELPENPDELPTANTVTGPALQTALKDTREQIQTGSWYVLLDFAKFLKEQMNSVWLRLGQPVGVAVTAEDKLVDALNKTVVDGTLAAILKKKTDGLTNISYYQAASTIPAHLSAAIKAAFNAETQLEAVKTAYERETSSLAQAWPLFLFPLADPKITTSLPPLSPLAPDAADETVDTNKKKVDALAKLVQDALPAEATAPTPDIPLVAKQPMDMREGWFVIRCFFDRPECGPLDLPLLSEPTQAFQMASFFDPDAPARPIRIALPLDTSPAGLRKFDKNTAFMISDMLCGQIDRVKGMTLADLVLSVLPWPFHKGLPKTDGGPCTSGGIEIGMICSLSIPIITICALLLLMIIVFLLDIIFRWVPFLIFCFPIPKLKAKA
jgi:hypothetical protein